jgi:hypothetical protein
MISVSMRAGFWVGFKDARGGFGTTAFTGDPAVSEMEAIGWLYARAIHVIPTQKTSPMEISANAVMRFDTFFELNSNSLDSLFSLIDFSPFQAN